MNGTGAHEQNFEGSEILLRAPGKSSSVIAINKKSASDGYLSLMRQ